jgi:siroheme synthase
VHGMHLAFTVAAGVTACAAVLAYRFLPARHREEDHDLAVAVAVAEA